MTTSEAKTGPGQRDPRNFAGHRNIQPGRQHIGLVSFDTVVKSRPTRQSKTLSCFSKMVGWLILSITSHKQMWSYGDGTSVYSLIRQD